jgi:hypothetical protein
MSQEARGLDAGQRLVERLVGAGDRRSAAIVRQIALEEKAHVAVGERGLVSDLGCVLLPARYWVGRGSYCMYRSMVLLLQLGLQCWLLKIAGEVWHVSWHHAADPLTIAHFH